MTSPPTDHRHAWLLERLERVHPASILDVACGEGWLLHHARKHGVPARGLDTDADRIRRLRDGGFDVAVADSSALPVGDAEFDVVVIRNALHHFVDPGAAMREALRVAKRAVVVTEPWFDLTVPSQRLSREVDDWVKSYERRAGLIHHAYLGAGDVLAHVPGIDRFDVESCHHRIDRPKSAGAWFEDIDDWLSRLDPDDPAHAERAELSTRIERDGTSAEGVMLVSLERRC